MKKFLQKFLASEDGPTAVEYGVMLALIVGVCITSVNLLAAGVAESYNDSANQIAVAVGS